MSLALAFFMLESEDPVISQLAIESHKASPLFRIMARLSPIVSGTGLPNSAAMTFQNRF